jgi:hypothetical protein
VVAEKPAADLQQPLRLPGSSDQVGAHGVCRQQHCARRLLGGLDLAIRSHGADEHPAVEALGELRPPGVVDVVAAAQVLVAAIHLAGLPAIGRRIKDRETAEVDLAVAEDVLHRLDRVFADWRHDPHRPE